MLPCSELIPSRKTLPSFLEFFPHEKKSGDEVPKLTEIGGVPLGLCAFKLRPQNIKKSAANAKIWLQKLKAVTLN